MGYTKIFNKIKLSSYQGRMKLFASLIKFLARKKITPNDITVWRLIFVIILAYFFYVHNLWAVLITCLIFGLTDFIDGDLARYMNLDNHKGRFFDTFVDNFVYSIVILGFIYVAAGNAIILAYHILIQLTVQVLAIIKKQKNKPSDWLIYAEAHEPIFKSIAHIVLIIFIVFNFNIINLTFIILNIWMSLVALNYLIKIKNQK